MFKKKPSFFYKKDFISTILVPFSWIYFLCFFIANLRFSRPKMICKKTICIGNIVVGGSGKTPICIVLCEALSKKFKNICFITKGYGRKSREHFFVSSEDSYIFDVNDIGDEPKLLGEYSDVFVVKKRNKVKCSNYDLAICDDGFFDKSIYTDCKIAVFDGNFFIGNGRMLPAGPLRSTMKYLKKADFVIITNNVNDEIQQKIKVVKKYVHEDNILCANLVVTSKHDKTKKYFAFSGIGENGKFLKSLNNYGIEIVGFVGFEDHQEYSDEILDCLQNDFIKSGADKLITTTKDFVKLSSHFRFLDKVDVFKISYEIADIDKIISFVL